MKKYFRKKMKPYKVFKYMYIMFRIFGQKSNCSIICSQRKSICRKKNLSIQRLAEKCCNCYYLIDVNIVTVSIFKSRKRDKLIKLTLARVDNNRVTITDGDSSKR